MIRVYARRSNARVADRLAESLRGDGQAVIRGNSGYFDADQIEPRATVVYHDGLVPELVGAYEDAGAEVRIIPALEDTYEDEAAPGPAEDEYEVVQNGAWYSLYGADGEKVGASQRSEAEAWAQLGDSD